MADKNIDEAKGRVKEAAGSLSDDDQLKEEGRHDQRAAEAKDKIDQASEKVKDKIDDLAEKFG